MFKALIVVLILITSSLAHAQMRVYNVAGNSSSTVFGDGGPATAAQVNGTEGIWLDGNCNVYHVDGNRRIRKTDAKTGIINTIAGGDKLGNTGDGGPSTAAKIATYGLFVDKPGNVYFPDPNSHTIRKIDATTGIISTIAGGGQHWEMEGPLLQHNLMSLLMYILMILVTCM